MPSCPQRCIPTALLTGLGDYEPETPMGQILFEVGGGGKVGNFLTENEEFCLDPAPSGVKLYVADLRPTLKCWSHAGYFQLQPQPVPSKPTRLSW